MTHLSDILDTNQLERDLADGFVRMAAHTDNPSLKILCYTSRAQYARHWNDVTRACRGLGIHLTPSTSLANATVISRGIPKFFTMSDTAGTTDDNFIISLEDDDEDVAQLQDLVVPLHTDVHCADKLDGAMCIGYIDDDGNFAVHTKGSFSSDEANIANRILHERHDITNMAKWLQRTVFNKYTTSSPIFEVISPQFPHVIDYGDTEDLFFLGWCDINSGLWRPADPHDPFVEAYELKTPDTIFDGPLAQALTLPPRKNCEGIVITINSQPQRLLKVKYEDFLEMQRITHSTSLTKQTEIAKNILTFARENGVSLTTEDDIRNLGDIWLRKICDVDSTAIRRATLVSAASAALAIANAAKPLFDDAFAQVIITWGRTNAQLAKDPTMTADEAFVRVTLDNVDPKFRPIVFATKKLYLKAHAGDYGCRDEVTRLIATWATKNSK